jgi:penicillin-binding protein 2
VPGSQRGTPPLRTVRLPRPRVEPLSTVRAPFFRSTQFFVRVGVLSMVALTAFAFLALRLWSLQVLHGAEYASTAQRQIVRTVDLPGTRAEIVDARGRPLATTDGRLVVAADADVLGRLDPHGDWHASASGMRTLGRLHRLTHVPLRTLIRRIKADVVRSPFAHAVVLPRLSRPLAFFLDERVARYPGLHVEALPVRGYPQGALGSEFLGLVGEVSPAELRKRGRRAQPGELVGQSGLEATYDRRLNGGFRRARVRVDAAGRTVGPLRLVGSHRRLPRLRLSIDATLQRAAERAIRDGINLAHRAGHPDADAGAAVVMNPWTGALYALASYPHFDQSEAARNSRYLSRLLQGQVPGQSLLDRATQGLYPTGSTFKPIVAEAALADGLITPYTELPCTGSLTVGNVVFHNVEPAINAILDLPQALEISCDTWFYRLGELFYQRQQQGDAAMQRWARALGLGHPTGLDVPGESGGVVPTPAWLRRTFSQPWARIWYEGTSVNLSIGQGYLAVTPLQLAVAYSALANGGTVVRPHVADALLGAHGTRRLAFPPRAHLRLHDIWAIRKGLFDAAHAPGGTSASIFGTFPIAVDGKTGTAQAPSGSDHSWYASWAPAYRPRVVVVVLIEHGGFAVEAAAPAAREIYQAYFHLRRG